MVVFRALVPPWSRCLVCQRDHIPYTCGPVSVKPGGGHRLLAHETYQCALGHHRALSSKRIAWKTLDRLKYAWRGDVSLILGTIRVPVQVSQPLLEPEIGIQNGCPLELEAIPSEDLHPGGRTHGI